MAQYNNEGKRVFPSFAEEVERKTKEMTFPKVMAVFARRRKEMEEEEARDAEAAQKEQERKPARQGRKRKRPSPEPLFVDDNVEEAQDLQATTDVSPTFETDIGSIATEQPAREAESPNASSAPKPFSALFLKAAGKRKSVTELTESASSKRPFAPPKKAAKKARTTKSTQTLNNRVNLHRGNLQALKHFRTLVSEAEVKCAKQDIPEVFENLRTRLHVMEFYGFLSEPDAEVLIQQSKVLDNDAGLPAVCFRSTLTGLRYPIDIRLDCRALFFRWKNGDYDPHLLRGITSTTSKKQDDKSTRHHRVDPNYPFKIDCSYFGPGELEIGQWWPMQLCAMRDGAHGEMEAGIHGKIEQGAFSIVVSGAGYLNIDNGNSLEYCGTSGSKGFPTTSTLHMLKSFKDGKQIRVLRSSSLGADNPYRPAMGLRYDGLYQIDSLEILDEDTAMHRFKMTRMRGQTPIRYQGVGARPHEEELSQFAKIKELFGK
ncbi:hypothetical protein N7G274_008022 [Stereocaulon virgatum]|uniref:YDG domain-containing protein n=1 Tax=Stereocaulon virgatum TaxID=373712 RepID=A0ABR4A1K3_9LECA